MYECGGGGGGGGGSFSDVLPVLQLWNTIKYWFLIKNKYIFVFPKVCPHLGKKCSAAITKLYFPEHLSLALLPLQFCAKLKQYFK